jgi:hypothetical protein
MICLALLPASRPVAAHERSESFSHWSYEHRELSGVVTVRSREVTRLTLPGEGIEALAPILAAHLGKTVAASVDGTPCAAVRPPYPLEAESGYIRIGVELQCPAGERLEIGVDAFFGVAPAHHHFIYVESESGTRREAILTVSSPALELDLRSPQNRGSQFWQFIEMGIGHIATGIDHLAFLLALLITARSARQVLIIVTGFTIGHSLTLSLAVLGMVQANRGAVESLIGLTIAVAAARNLIRGEAEGRVAALGAALLIGSILLVPDSLRPDMPAMLIAALALATASVIWRGSLHSGGELHSNGGLHSGGGLRSDKEAVRGRLMMAIGFGLIHGLSFASALQALNLLQNMLLRTLVGFNIGVEIGQLTAVALAVLVARGMSRLWPAALASDVPAAVLSAVLLAVGISWFLTRAVALGAPL